MALLPLSQATMLLLHLAQGACLDMHNLAHMWVHMYPHTHMHSDVHAHQYVHAHSHADSSPIQFKCVCTCQTCSAELMLEMCIKCRAYMAHHHTICCLGIPLILCCC